jgi:multidrug efflux pump subunit AcrB
VPAIKYLYLRVEPGRIRIIAEPVETRDTDSLMDAITDKYREFAGMRAFATRGSIITSNNGGTRAINLDISGPRLDDIYATTLAAYREAQEVFDRPRLRADPRTLSLAQPLVEVRPRWARAAEAGLSAEELGFTVAALTDGAYVDEFFLDDEKIDIYLYGAPGGVRDLEDIGRLPVYTPQGTVLPLSSIADVIETVDTDQVRRVDGRRTVTLSIIPPRSVALETGVEMVQRDLMGALRDQGAIPAGVSIDITGASDQLNTPYPATAGGGMQPRGLSAGDHDHDPARHRQRAGGVVAAESDRRRAARIRNRGAPSALRHDLDARVPDPHGRGGQQPHPHRRSVRIQRAPRRHGRAGRGA